MKSFELYDLGGKDYYPFGMGMPGRSFSAGDVYRFGFQGFENESQLNLSGNLYSTYFRLYDARIGKWLTRDPENLRFAQRSPYIAFKDNPIIYIDPYGNTDFYNRRGQWIGTDGIVNGQKYIVFDRKLANLIKSATLFYIDPNDDVLLVEVSNSFIENIELTYLLTETDNLHEEAFYGRDESILFGRSGPRYVSGDLPYPTKELIQKFGLFYATYGIMPRYWVHSHPMGDPKNGIILGEESGLNAFKPSGNPSKKNPTKDYGFAGILEGEGGNPNIYGVVAGYGGSDINNRERTLGFYTSKVYLGTMKLEDIKLINSDPGHSIDYNWDTRPKTEEEAAIEKGRS